MVSIRRRKQIVLRNSNFKFKFFQLKMNGYLQRFNAYIQQIVINDTFKKVEKKFLRQEVNIMFNKYRNTLVSLFSLCNL